MGKGSESVLQGRRILELAAEEDEANSVVLPGGVLQEDNSVNKSSSSSSVAVGCQWRDQYVEPSPWCDG